jgi:hypothetical protein
MSLSAGGAGGGDSLMDRVLADGRIRWQALFGAVVGGVAYAVFQGWISTVLALFRVPVTWLSGLTSFYGDLVGLIYGVPAAIISGSWDQVLPLVESAGILGFVVALAIVLTTLYVVAEVVSRL